MVIVLLAGHIKIKINIFYLFLSVVVKKNHSPHKDFSLTDITVKCNKKDYE